MNSMLDETRTERIDLGLPFLKQIRVSPTQTWGDFFLSAAINHVLHARNVRGDWRGANRLLGRIIGPEPDGLGVTAEDQLEALTGVSRSDGRQNSKGNRR